MDHYAQDLISRVEEMARALIASYNGDRGFSGATKGKTREGAIRGLLERTLPPSYRIGTGDICDSWGDKSGEIDIVVETARALSFPMEDRGPRVLLVEGVGTALEVKSDLQGQWDEIVAKAAAVGRLRYGGQPVESERELQEWREWIEARVVELDQRQYVKPGSTRPGGQPIFTSGRSLREPRRRARDLNRTKWFGAPPFFVVGFQGWKTAKPIQSRMDGERIHGVLQLEPLLYCWRQHGTGHSAVGGKAMINFLQHVNAAVAERDTSHNAVNAYLRQSLAETMEPSLMSTGKPKKG